MQSEIEAWLNGELRGNDLERFEAELARDPALREELEAMRPLVGDLNRMGIARRIELAENQRFERKRLRKNAWLLGTALLATSWLGWFFFGKNIVEKNIPSKTETPANDTLSGKNNPDLRQNPPAKPDSTGGKNAPETGWKPVAKKQGGSVRDYAALASSFYKNPDLALLRGVGEQNADVFGTALEALDAGDFQKVIGLMQAVLSGDPQYLKARLLLGHTFFREGRFVDAERDFALLVQNGIAPWAGECEWFGLLSKLAQGKVNDPVFQRDLDKIAANPRHRFQREALLLKEDLH